MTPRRILLLMGGLFAFGMVYAIYARVFGWLDGLPILPTRMLAGTDGTFRPPMRLSSPTIERLKQSFGDTAPETEPAFYPTQLEFRNGDTSIVLASGSPPAAPRSKRVTLTPFSAAVFSKPRPAYLMQPGEVNEITTFHSDKAVLEFDQIINSAADMNSAKLVRMELISDPELSIPASDERAGIVHITNNQRSGDPNRTLVLKTVGPVFYRDPKYATGPDQLGPDMWTDSAVEIVDRSNLPRKPDVAAATAPAKSEETRNPSTVKSILDGDRLPPPTVTAVGMRVYLEPDEPLPNDPKSAKSPPKNAQPKKGSAGFSGVRRVELLEKVLLHLWVESGQGTLVGSGGKPSTIPEPPFSAAAVAGGLLPGSYAARELGRDLLQVETRGPFAYDAEKNLARFDVLPQADPSLTNDVRVTKVPPRLARQSLFSQVLEIEFNGPPTGNQPSKPPANSPVASQPPKTGDSATAPAGGPRFKQLHAWTYTPGRFLIVSSDADELSAYGQDLVHEQIPEQGREQTSERTTLTGAPLIAYQQRNILNAGGPKNPAVLIIEPVPGIAPPAGQEKGPKANQATVRGAGRVELYDAAANANTITAVWQTSMVHTKERVNDIDLDLFVLTDGAKFEDVRADYWLKGRILKLWLTQAAPSEQPPDPDSSPTSRALPHRIQAIGDVTGHSADMDIEQTDQLNSLFRDIPPPEPVEQVMPPMSPAGPAAAPKEPRDPVAPQQPTAPPEPEKPRKPPTKIRARTIDTWVVRYPMPKPATPPAAPAAAPPAPVAGAPPSGPDTGGLKYQLEKAHCEGMVSVHQDPDPSDPAKPRGTDIFGSLMLIDSTPDGSILTVFGWDNRPGEVHNDGTDLIGPKIIVDQLHNLSIIEGRGSVAMPASSDLTGAELKTAEPVVIQFRDGMKFLGALKTAEFFGKVTASQGESWVTCHTMQVIFDRPVYFTQANRPGGQAKPAPPPAKGPATTVAKGPNAKGPNGQAQDDDKPKIDRVYCYPAPADSADSELEKLVTFNQFERDPLTSKPVRKQKIVAQELTIRAQVRDADGGEPYRTVLAQGPGVVRTWAPASKDDESPNPAAPAPAAPPPPRQPGQQGQPGNANPPAETEMKLTVVNFSGRMFANDKGERYKDARFSDNIEVFNVPTDNPDLIIERHKLPPRAVLLTCQDKLLVWTYKKGNDPAQQFMHAYGNAYLQNEDYDGSGAVIKSEGKKIVFEGEGTVPARIKSRSGGSDQPGKKITYDRSTGHYMVEGSLGGTFTTPPQKKNPPMQPMPVQPPLPRP